MNENKCTSGKDMQKDKEVYGKESKMDSKNENMNAMDQMNQYTDQSDCGCDVSDSDTSGYNSIDEMGMDQPVDLEIVEVDILAIPADDMSASSDFSDSDYQNSVVGDADGCGCGDSSYQSGDSVSGKSDKKDYQSSGIKDKDREPVMAGDDLASGKTCKR